MNEASELLVEVTILAVLFCCYTVSYYIKKSVMSGLLSTWVCLLLNGVGLFSEERILENTPTSLFEQPLRFIAHGHIFESLRYKHIQVIVFHGAVC